MQSLIRYTLSLIKLFSFAMAHHYITKLNTCTCITLLIISLTFLGLSPKYSIRNRSISWMLMAWLLVSPDHRWYWLYLTHWGWVTHICISKSSIIGSDNGLSPGRRQAIIWTNVGILLIGLLRTNLSEILIKIHTFSFQKMPLKMSSGKWWPFCLGFNVLNMSLFPLGEDLKNLHFIVEKWLKMQKYSAHEQSNIYIFSQQFRTQRVTYT